LAHWHSFKSASTSTVEQEVREMLIERAYFCRQRGDYRGSLALLKLAARRFGWSRRTSSAALKLVPHWARYAALRRVAAVTL
jgi:hypothetical protein